MSSLTFQQGSGDLDLIGDDGSAELLGTGWAGNDSRAKVNLDHVQGRNNPDMQAVRFIGPLPRWCYTVGAPIHHPELGVLAFPLTPDPDTNGEMCGRGDFFIHGAGGDDPENSSEGCIIMPHDVRVHLALLQASGVTRLQVTA